MVILGILAGTLFFILPIIIIVLIVVALSKKNKDNKTEFEESVRNVYIYIILISTLIAIVIGIIVIFRVGLDVALPEKTINERANYYELSKNENIVELLTNLTVVIVSVPIFLYYNGIAKKEKKYIKQEERN